MLALDAVAALAEQLQQKDAHIAALQAELEALQRDHAAGAGVIADLTGEVLRLQAELHRLRNDATVTRLRAELRR